MKVKTPPGPPAAPLPLHQAVASRNAWTLMQLLMAGEDQSLCNPEGQTPREVAHAKGADSLRFLLDEAATPKRTDTLPPNKPIAMPGPWAKLRARVVRDAHIIAERTRLERGYRYARLYSAVMLEHETVHVPPPLRPEDAVRFTAHAAAQRGDMIALQQALDGQPSLATARTPAGWTPMHYAIAANSVEMVTYLAQCGGNVGARNIAGVPAWACAVMPQMFPYLRTLSRWEGGEPQRIESDPDAIAAFVKSRLGEQGATPDAISEVLSELSGIPVSLVHEMVRQPEQRRYVGNQLALSGKLRDLRNIEGAKPLTVNLQDVRGLVEALVSPAAFTDVLPLDVCTRLREILGGDVGIQQMVAEQLALSLGSLTWEGIAEARASRQPEPLDNFDSQDEVDPLLAEYTAARLQGLRAHEVMTMPVHLYESDGAHSVNFTVHREPDEGGDSFVFLVHNMSSGTREHNVDADTGNVQPLSFSVKADALAKSPDAFARLLQAMTAWEMSASGLYAHLGVFVLHMDRAVPGCVSLDDVGGDVIYAKRPQRSGNCAVISKRVAAWVQLALNTRRDLGPSASVAEVHDTANFLGRALRDFRVNRLMPKLKHAKALGFRPDVLREQTNCKRLEDAVLTAVRIWGLPDAQYDVMRTPALNQLEHVLRKHGDLVPRLPSRVLDKVIREDDGGVMRRLLAHGAEPSTWTLWRHGKPRMRQLCGG